MAYCPFNLYTDSHYIARALQALETAAYIDPANNQVQELFSQVQRCLQTRVHPCYVGPLAEGNALADQATQVVNRSHSAGACTAISCITSSK